MMRRFLLVAGLLAIAPGLALADTDLGLFRLTRNDAAKTFRLTPYTPPAPPAFTAGWSPVLPTVGPGPAVPATIAAGVLLSLQDYTVCRRSDGSGALLLIPAAEARTCTP